MIVLLVIPLVAIIGLLIVANKKSDYARISALNKAVMFFGVITMIYFVLP